MPIAMKAEPIRDTIRNSYLAEGLDEEQLDRLTPLATVKCFEAGQVILSQFETTKYLLILREGRATVSTVLGEPIAYVSAGMPIGEVSLFDDKPRSATVTADADCEVLVIEAEALMNLLRARCDIALRALTNLSRVLCGRLRSANLQLAAMMAVEEASRP